MICGDLRGFVHLPLACSDTRPVSSTLNAAAYYILHVQGALLRKHALWVKIKGLSSGLLEPAVEAQRQPEEVPFGDETRARLGADEGTEEGPAVRDLGCRQSFHRLRGRGSALLCERRRVGDAGGSDRAPEWWGRRRGWQGLGLG